MSEFCSVQRLTPMALAPLAAYDMRFGMRPRLTYQAKLTVGLFWQERPCTRCVKRDIGHLCHDEPREPVRRSKGDHSHTPGEDEVAPKQEELSNSRTTSSVGQQQTDDQVPQETGLEMNAPGDAGNRKANIQLTQSAQVPNAATIAGIEQCEYTSYLYIN